MNFLETILFLIKNRSSCRYFNPEYKFTPKHIETILRSVDSGPSSGGLRAFEIYHTEDPKKKMALQKASLNQEFISKASSVFCICSDPQKSIDKYGERGNLYGIQDATIAGCQITFATIAIGLASCWVGSIDVKKIRKIYEVPKEMIPLSLICIGVPARY